MKLNVLVALLLINVLKASAQKTYMVSATPISRAVFNQHLAVNHRITKPSQNIKKGKTIRIQTAKRIIKLTDDPELQEYHYIGNLKSTPLIVIHELESNTEEYYFINKETATIDTLLEKPIFYPGTNKIVCLEGMGTDMKQRIQLAVLKNNRIKTSAYIQLKGEIPLSYVFWYNERTLYLSNNDTIFYKITLPDSF